MARFHHAFFAGSRDALPLVVAVAPFALVFGATAAQEGYTLFEAFFASATVFAGASQFVFVEVYGNSFPAWFAILAVFAVNFRHILYSASIGRWMQNFSGFQKSAAFFFMTDLQWAASETRAQAAPSGGLTPAWYFGFALPLYVLWISATVIGAIFGALIEQPERYGLDFLLPIYFLVILMGFRKRTHFLPVVGVSATVAALTMLTVGEPWQIPAGAVAGVGFAAMLPPERSKAAFQNGLNRDA